MVQSSGQETGIAVKTLRRGRENCKSTAPDGNCSHEIKRHLLLGRKAMTNLESILEKAMAPHSSTLAWEIPGMEKPGRLQSMGSYRVGHD